MKQLLISISERLSNNSSSEEIFNASKYEHETALKNSQEINATGKTRTTAHLMVTAKQVILYINALFQPPLIQTKNI